MVQRRDFQGNSAVDVLMGSQQARIPLSASKHFVTMPACAYCAREAPLTREHLIPAFMYDYQKQFTPFIGWSELAEKMVGGELQIKDVCAPCNNGSLSALDDYGRRMLTEYGLQANQPWPTLRDVATYKGTYQLPS